MWRIKKIVDKKVYKMTSIIRMNILPMNSNVEEKLVMTLNIYIYHR